MGAETITIKMMPGESAAIHKEETDTGSLEFTCQRSPSNAVTWIAPFPWQTPSN